MNFKYLRDNRMFRVECVVESLATSPQYLLTTKGVILSVNYCILEYLRHTYK